MSGIYLHIPYCKKKCNYCNFYSLASEKSRSELIPRMIRELELQVSYLINQPVNSIYFGGGTPSILTGDEISRLMGAIRKNFEVNADAEITLEANPDDLSIANLMELKNIGINRLSVGIQSFEDMDLQFLSRTHTGKQAVDCIKRSQDAGFSNLSIDLIYGIPTLKTTDWENNLQKAIEMDIPHISAYALTVEEKTALAVKIRKGEVPDVDDALQAKHFEILVDLLETSGYLHYEISNFCKPGMFARHNSAYWKRVSYLGIGPSAHSFNGSSRQWNVSNLGQYIDSLRMDQVPFEKEILSPAQQFNEYVMTSLRTMWGCNIGYIEDTFSHEWAKEVLYDAGKHLKSGLLKVENNVLSLTREGKFKADGIAAELFRV